MGIKNLTQTIKKTLLSQSHKVENLYKLSGKRQQLLILILYQQLLNKSGSTEIKVKDELITSQEHFTKL